MKTLNPKQTVFFPIPQGQNYVQVTGAGLPFAPVFAMGKTSSGAGGPVIDATPDLSTLTADGALFNLTGTTLDANQVLIATFYGAPVPCADEPLPDPQPVGSFDNVILEACQPGTCPTTTFSTTTSTLSTTSTSTSSTTTCGSVALATVSPNIFGPTVASFGIFPAGNYEVVYLYGALQYSGVTNPPQFNLNYWTTDAGYWIVANGGLLSIQAPGNSTVYASEENVEDANNGASVQFSHSGGSIGMYLQDNPYSDNVAGTQTNPTFTLFSICGGPTSSSSTSTQSTSTSSTSTTTASSTTTTSSTTLSTTTTTLSTTTTTSSTTASSTTSTTTPA